MGSPRGLSGATSCIFPNLWQVKANAALCLCSTTGYLWVWGKSPGSSELRVFRAFTFSLPFNLCGSWGLVLLPSAFIANFLIPKAPQTSFSFFHPPRAPRKLLCTNSAHALKAAISFSLKPPSSVGF